MNPFFSLRQPGKQMLLWALLVVVVVLFVGSFYHRWIHMDDAWSADEALMMARTGQIRSEIFTGFLRYEYKVLNAHKLHIMLGALYIKLFGFSPWVVKAVPLPFLVVLVLAMLHYQRRFTPYHGTVVGLFTVLVLLVHASIFEYSYSYRPEISHACLGFCSFLLLHKGLVSNRFLPVAAAGLLAGLAAFIHLNGLTFIAAGGGLLFFRGAFKKTFLFGGVAAAVTALYFFDVRTPQDFELFLFQFRNDPALRASNFSPWHYLTKITDEHMRLFRDWPQASFTGLLLLVLLLTFNSLRRTHAFLLQYTLLLVLAVAVITRDTNIKYYILYIPFFTVLVVQGIAHLYAQPRAVPRYVLAGGLAVYLAIHLVLDVRLIGRRADQVTSNARIAAFIPEGSAIVAPITFIFNQIDRYDIQTLEVYRYQLQRGAIQLPFWTYCQQAGRQYVILNRQVAQELHLSWEDVQAGGTQYDCIGVSGDGYAVCRLKR
jgi:hypothetical protein